MFRFALAIALLCSSQPVGAAAPVNTKQPPRPPRVLLFASGPTREYQFLRTLLLKESDPKRVEVSVHLQPPPGRKEARPGVIQDVPKERLLASFPARLEVYDAIVAFDPDWSRLSPDSLAVLKAWVERGGILIFTAGPIHTSELARAVNADKYKPILDLLPVLLTDLRASKIAIDTSKPRRLNFPAAPGERGFLKLDAKGKDALAGWEEFFTGSKTGETKKDAELRHGFFSYYPLRGVKSDTVVLAAFADPKTRMKDGKDQPFLVMMPRGKGRVVYLSSGETWRLRQSKQAFHKRFWLGLLAIQCE